MTTEVPVRLTDAELAALDEAIARGRFANRSEALRKRVEPGLLAQGRHHDACICERRPEEEARPARRDGQWVHNFGGLVRSQIEGMVGAVMQERDAYGIRRYEQYAAGERERRWQPLQAMTIDVLRSVARETRTQARVLEIKGEGYNLFIQALEKLGPTATVKDVYEEVAPKIMEARHAA
jgi:Arc/MetJ-type ribon-helix-helix transcriptional regulator